MSFSYNFDTAPQIAYVRLLIPDTVDDPPNNPALFSDAEITAFFQIQASQFQSSMFYSGVAGRNLPTSYVSYLRVAALAIDSLASSSSRLSIIMSLMDVKLGAKDAAASLRDQAKQYRTTDDESGAFAIIEQVNTSFAFHERYWKQIQRQQGGGGL